MNPSESEQDILGWCWYLDGARLDRISATQRQCYATYGRGRFRVIRWEAFSSTSLSSESSATSTEPSSFNLVRDLIDHLDEEERKRLLQNMLHSKTK